jgi:hypothetical protein
VTGRRKKYGWLYHGYEGVWMPPDGSYAAEKEGAFWLLWRCETPYKIDGAVLVQEDGRTLKEVVEAAESGAG